MWDFIRKIFSEREGEVTVVVLDDQDPDGSSSFKLSAQDIVKITLFVVIVSVLLTTIIFFATPIGSLYQRQQDESLRNEALAITERMLSIQDSLEARDRQLNDIKEILQTVPDTTFEVTSMNRPQPISSGRTANNEQFVHAYEMLSQNEIIFSGSMDKAPDFPSSYPIRGTLSQAFEPDKGHYGIDIAARVNTNFTALADGVVIYTDWTINYGHVVYIQHSEGIVTVYKHASKILKKQGDYVLKGDILGTVANTGVLSSGSHLHLEIWKNGIPQNPEMYLIN